MLDMGQLCVPFIAKTLGVLDVRVVCMCGGWGEEERRRGRRARQGQKEIEGGEKERRQRLREGEEELVFHIVGSVPVGTCVLEVRRPVEVWRKPAG